MTDSDHNGSLDGSREAEKEKRHISGIHSYGIVASGAIAIVAVTFASAEDRAATANLRGSGVSYSGSTLKVKPLEGKAVVSVELADGWEITSLARGSLTSIQPGDYVGTVSLPKAGGSRALEAPIFPPALKGLGEGSRGWDLKPHSSITNASVSNPTNAPAVTFAGGAGRSQARRSGLRPRGGRRFPAPAHHVVIGKDGVVPPM